MSPLPVANPFVSFPAMLLAQVVGPPAGGGGAAEQMFPWVTLPLILLLGWFMVLRPERERQRKQDQLLAGLKKNDRVLTTAGMYGTVANVDRDGQRVSLKIDDTGSVKIMVTLSSIARVLDPTTEAGAPSGD
ncbi:MAG: preprotein translocase subunit YajC [Pirellulales bacterium]|jgi:preprotein translocase subunit YajC